jgi:adenosylmethionine-8-amino-7-oxononanoate aminotransferase
VGDVRVIGGVGVVELAPAPGDAGGYFDEVGPRVARAFLDRGLLIRPLGNVVYFMPPYAITDEEAAWALGEIAAVVGAVDKL